MILKPPRNAFAKEYEEIITDEKDIKMLEQARKLKAMVDPIEIKFARMFYEKSYRENIKKETQEEAMIDAAVDIWLIARLLSERFGTVLHPK